MIMQTDFFIAFVDLKASPRGLGTTERQKRQLPEAVPAHGEGESRAATAWPPFCTFVGRTYTRGERRDSNPRSPGPQPGALTTRLRSPRDYNAIVPQKSLSGKPGFSSLQQTVVSPLSVGG